MLPNLLTPTWGTPHVLSAVAVVSAALYLACAVRLWRRRRRWPVWRAVCFLVGCALLVAITGLGIETYSREMVSMFMFQQLTLMMAIPPFLVLGSPGTLLLRATPHRGIGRVVLRMAHGMLRSRLSRWALSPWCALPLYLLAFYGLYLAGIADMVLSLPGGHVGLDVVFLLSGILFTIPILSSDPLPVRLSHGGRALDVFAEAALHAFFGVFLMMANTVFVRSFVDSTRALGIDPLLDQQLAGGLAWSYGEGPTVVILVYVMHRWFREDTAAAAANDRYVDAHGTTELDEYNEYLRRLSDNDLNIR